MSNSNQNNETRNELPIFQRFRAGEEPTDQDDAVRVKKEEETPSVQAKERTTDDGKASAVELMLLDLKERFACINICNQHLYYYRESEGYWKLIPANLADIELRVMLTTKWIKVINGSSMNELYKWLLIETPSKDSSVFNTGREYLNFKDCAYNWKKDEIIEDRQLLYFSYSLAVDYPKKEKSNGAFGNLLDDIFGDDKKTKHEFSKFVGLAMSDIRNLKYIIHLYGPSNTSKSTILNAIKFIVGAKMCSSLSFSQLSQEFYLSSLHGCRLNISGEISGVSTSKLDALRSLSGNDSVAASHKFRDSFQFDNRCLLIFACNVLPRITDFLEMQSYVSRMIIFPFKNVIKRKNWRTDFEEELHADVAGIVDFAIKGLKRLEADNYVICETAEMRLCKSDYTGLFDSFTLFCDKYIEDSPKNFTTSSDIVRAYQAFCYQNEFEPLENNQWPQVLKRRYSCTSKIKYIPIGEDGLKKTVRGYVGVALTKKVENLFQQGSKKEVTVQDVFNQKNKIEK